MHRIDVAFILFCFFQAEDGIRDLTVTGVQTCALPIWCGAKLNALRSESRAAVRMLTRWRDWPSWRHALNSSTASDHWLIPQKTLATSVGMCLTSQEERSLSSWPRFLIVPAPPGPNNAVPTASPVIF